MEPGALISFLGRLEKLKCNTRHSWTSTGRQESVAEHSWRLAVMALLIGGEFPGLDMARVLKMCLVHDWGEAVTGDIPSFRKTAQDEEREALAVDALLSGLPPETAREYAALFQEMTRCESREARLFTALDKLEAILQHNEAAIETWIPLEYESNLTYGTEECGQFAYTRALREAARAMTEGKIAHSRA